MAVCLLPGTEVAFEKEIECLGAFLSWMRTKRIGEKVARFRQVNKDQPHRHHDALEFPNGECVLLNRLCDGRSYQLVRARWKRRPRRKLKGALPTSADAETNGAAA